MHMQKDGVQETFLIIPNVFVETMIHFLSDSLMNTKVQMNSIYLKSDVCDVITP